MDVLKGLPGSMTGLYEPSLSVKILGVAKKYNQPDVSSPHFCLVLFHCEVEVLRLTTGKAPLDAWVETRAYKA